MEKQPILFFDGVCGLCNRAVDFVLREDRDQKFLFAPLQGETFKAFVKDHPEASAVDSAFVLCYTAQGEQLLMRSDAMFYILGQLPQFGWIARIGHFIPRPIRDAVYRLIASTRYRVWGKRDSCRLPTPEEEQRFLP
ncbi:MAG: DCC1-like thiol-disulfide oxidoreductase family protein [Chthoniobacterales bacterium]